MAQLRIVSFLFFFGRPPSLPFLLAAACLERLLDFPPSLANSLK
jgi:hypothetical protein